MYNAQCDIISKKQIHCLLDYLTLNQIPFLSCTHQVDKLLIENIFFESKSFC